MDSNVQGDLGEAGWGQHRSMFLGMFNMALRRAAVAQTPTFSLPSLFCPLSRHHAVAEEVEAFLSPSTGRGPSENRDVILGAPGSREAGLCLRGRMPNQGSWGGVQEQCSLSPFRVSA